VSQSRKIEWIKEMITIRGGYKLWAALAAAALVAGAVIAVVVVTSGPSYAHPWCGPVIAELDNGHEKVSDQLAHLEPYRSHPLVAAYITDTVNFQAAYAIEQADLGGLADEQAFADLAAANRAGNRWKAAGQAIRTACRS
jgi:hypothetical protein